MTADWVIATDSRRLPAMVHALRGLGGDGVRVLAVGSPALAEVAAGACADSVTWIATDATTPAEARTPDAVRAVLESEPRAVLAASTPAARVLLGAVATALGAPVVPGVLSVVPEADAVLVESSDLGGRRLRTLVAPVPFAGLFAGPDVVPPVGVRPATVERVAAGTPLDVRVEHSASAVGAGVELATAERIVAVGRGLKSKDDLALVRELAERLDAAIACSMPIADDFRWLPSERYVGRSGQQVAPRLYFAVGISGAPQHLDGVRDAKVVVAVNSDPDAPIFRRADYGVVGDLYEVLPALGAALAGGPSTATREEQADE